MVDSIRRRFESIIKGLSAIPMPTQFTVIITTKNRPGYLREAIDSVLQQKSSHQGKIVIVDDGSDVPVFQQVEDCYQDRCKILRNDESVGVSAARNQGIQATDTDWLIFLDDDDWLAEDFLVKMAETTEAIPPPDFIWPSRTMVYEDQGVRVRKRASVPFVPTTKSPDEVLAGLFDATSSGMAFKRSCLLQVGGFDEGLTVSEDRDLIFKLLAMDYCARPEEAAVLFFRIHGGPRLSQDEKRESQAEADLTVLSRHKQFLGGHPILADRFMGRVAKRLWENRFYKEAIAVTNLQCHIAPFSLRARKRQIGWHLLAFFRVGKSLGS
ncbi:glycosyltransferase family 2 protein [Marinobacter sp. ATCH36]|uniref:glycosyltransferase family 2 protein n=1 Tax=Marinobacter sp. ATCH36 TaxID=2945106 RepID=UPI0020228150|nr:glycosyltransferase family 2 protein [Marinobacter sp. ATCH36]MCL7945959.1 glycosyltransferase [Marinobacter sp. ATCH36]